MKDLLVIIVFFISNVGYCQPSRKDILKYRIKSVTSTDFRSNQEKGKEIKKYYNVNGYDSSWFVNGKPTYLFVTEFADKRVKQVQKLDVEGNIYALYLYHYNSDSTYSIEMKEEGKTTHDFTLFDSNEKAVMTVFPGLDTMFFHYDALLKMEKIDKRRKDGTLETIMIKYDSLGFPLRISFGKDEREGYYIFKNNKDGITEEIKKYAKGKEKDEFIGKTLFIYEFYDRK
jgi:hypothetical protein